MVSTEPAIASDIAEQIATYASKVEALGVTVLRFTALADAAAFIAQTAAEEKVAQVVMSHELADAAPGLIPALAASGTTATPVNAPGEARDQPIGLSLAKMAIAETGSVLLAENTLADRSIGLITKYQIVLCRTADLQPSLDEAGRALRAVAMRPGGGYATLVTGPSKTGDIEMSLTVGVQGPARVSVIFVDHLNERG